MDNRYSGFCEGPVVVPAAKIGELDKKHTLQFWMIIENGDESSKGSCGSMTLDGEDRVVGLFHYKSDNRVHIHGYEICGGEQILWA